MRGQRAELLIADSRPTAHWTSRSAEDSRAAPSPCRKSSAWRCCWIAHDLNLVVELRTGMCHVSGWRLEEMMRHTVRQPRRHEYTQRLRSR